jgi:hypothetical protein
MESPKLEFGLDAISKYVTVDGAGADFMKGFTPSQSTS